MTGSSEPATPASFFFFFAEENPEKTAPIWSHFSWRDEGMKGAKGDDERGVTYESVPGNELSFKGSVECGKDRDATELEELTGSRTNLQ